jgi:hypothetical protein
MMCLFAYLFIPHDGPYTETNGTDLYIVYNLIDVIKIRNSLSFLVTSTAPVPLL